MKCMWVVVEMFQAHLSQNLSESFQLSWFLMSKSSLENDGNDDNDTYLGKIKTFVRYLKFG